MDFARKSPDDFLYFFIGMLAYIITKERYEMKHPRKTYIAKAVKYEIRRKGSSLRRLADHIEEMSYPQIHRITSEQNYNIDTLLKVLDALNLDIIIKEKD